MNKRERVIAALEKRPVDGIPSSFSLHFPKDRNSGDAGVKAHLDFFKESDADIAKIMNENLVPVPYMGCPYPESYDLVKGFDRNTDFIKRQLDFTKKIVAGLEEPVFTMGTLHGICASALHPVELSVGDYELARDIQLNALRTREKETLAAFDRITEGMIELIKGYKEAGLDSVYYAALGAETRWFTDEEFEKWIKPFDLRMLKAIKDEGMYCFLHICKDGLNMNRYKGYGEYCDCVNWGVYEVPYSLEEGRKLFPNATILGGLPNRSGVLVDGTEEEIEKAVEDVINGFGRVGFILGADCTIATEQDMDKLRCAIHKARRC